MGLLEPVRGSGRSSLAAVFSFFRLGVTAMFDWGGFGNEIPREIPPCRILWQQLVGERVTGPWSHQIEA
jgi:hypothetical protein